MCCCCLLYTSSDPQTFEMMSKGQAKGVFQFESSGMRQVLVQLKPESVEDLIAVISLYRPGPMDSIPKYIRNRHNPQEITYKTPLLKGILDVTYGCIAVSYTHLKEPVARPFPYRKRRG